MPKYKVTMNDGRVKVIDAPDESAAATQAMGLPLGVSEGDTTSTGREGVPSGSPVSGRGPLSKFVGAMKEHPVATGTTVAGMLLPMLLPGAGSVIGNATRNATLAAGGAGWGKVYDAAVNNRVSPSMGEDISDMAVPAAEGFAGPIVGKGLHMAGSKMMSHAAERTARGTGDFITRNAPAVTAGAIGTMFGGGPTGLASALGLRLAMNPTVEKYAGKFTRGLGWLLGGSEPMMPADVTPPISNRSWRPRPKAELGGTAEAHVPAAPDINPLTGDARWTSKPVAPSVGESGHFGEAGNLPELSRPDLLKEAKMRAGPVAPRLSPELPPLPPPPPSRIDALKAAQRRTSLSSEIEQMKADFFAKHFPPATAPAQAPVRPSMQGLQDMAPMPNPNAAHLAELDALGPSIKVQRPLRVVEPEPVSTFAPGRGIDADPLLPPAEMQPVYTPKPKPKPARPTKPTSHTHTGPSWGDRMTKKK